MRRTRKTASPDAKPARQSGLLRDTDTARPLASLVFLSPALVFYAVGCIWVRPDLAARADILLREALKVLGVSGVLAPTWLAVIVLIIWHLAKRDPWRISPWVLLLMLAETVLLAVPLFAIEPVFNAVAHSLPTLELAPTQPSDATYLAVAMTSIGAGIYEELLFRLLLVGGTIFILRHGLKENSFGGHVAVILIAGGLFAGAHLMDDPSQFAWVTFLFRTAAGAYLGFIFVYRGFGIAAGVHILFDMIVKMGTAMGYGA